MILRLDVRQYYGPNPMRVLIDTHLKTDPSKKLLSDGKPTIVINSKIEQKDGQTQYIKVDDTSDLTNILRLLFGLGITSLLVEGGASLLQSFINQGLWHEARVIRTKPYTRSWYQSTCGTRQTPRKDASGQ
jgi:diaminohydroxyphosphoribosylaminopyrimidine deaminase/5-amino-6-(5-phosphoribosylamino)uracil reductase